MTTRDDIEAFNRAFAEALAQRDVDRLGEMYTEDARLLFHGTPIVRGRSAIEAMFGEELAAGPGTIHFESEDVLEDGALVVDVGRYVTPNGRGKYVVVYQRQPDGALKLAVDAATSDGTGAGPST